MVVSSRRLLVQCTVAGDVWVQRVVYPRIQYLNKYDVRGKNDSTGQLILLRMFAEVTRLRWQHSRYTAWAW